MASSSTNSLSQSSEQVDLQPTRPAPSGFQSLAIDEPANADSFLREGSGTLFASVGLVEGATILLDAMWPSPQSVHQLAVKHANGRFQNLPVTEHHDAPQTVAKYSKLRADCYFACAEYANGENRTAANAISAAAFWLDLDCGRDKYVAGKGYEDVTEAHTALKAFLLAARLPAPTHIVNSGGGLHVYWVMDAVLMKDAWQRNARMLKDLTHAAGLLADDSRTADIASILRVPGTMNFKYTPPRPVVLLEKSIRRIPQAEMLTAIEKIHYEFCAPDDAKAKKVVVMPLEHSPAQVGSRQPNLDKLKSALKVLDPDCDDETWKLRRLAPLARLGTQQPELAFDLRVLAMDWSSGRLQGKECAAWFNPGKTNGMTGEEAFPYVWKRFLRESFSGATCSIGTIFYDAQQLGWVDGKSMAVPTSDDEGSSPGHTNAEALATLQAAIEKSKNGDAGAAFRPEVVAAYAAVNKTDMAEAQRIRAALKKTRKVSLAAFDAAVKAVPSDGNVSQTHHGYATDVLERLTIDGWSPVAHEGDLYTVDKPSSLWVSAQEGSLEKLVAQVHDGKENCVRATDYSGIAQHARMLVNDDRFFNDAPIGLACPDGFYRIVDDQCTVEPLAPEHRQRVQISVSPVDQEIPLFDAFMHQTFKSETDGEELQQRTLVQELAGAIMLGLMPRHQKAILFIDSYGRAGKGTLSNILGALVPPSFVGSVTPFEWKKEYYLMNLAGLRLNVVGELPEREPIPSAIFKTVLGGDIITGRNPTQRPVSFRNGAAHLVMSNHLITTTDHSEAFFARWIIVEFPNSLLRSRAPLDSGLVKRITENELPGIAFWALEGAKRLLRQKTFSASMAHDRLMAKWRRTSSSLEEFLDENCEFGTGRDFREKRSHFYATYSTWCAQNGRSKPFSRSRVKELLTININHGVTLVEINGYETIKGLRFKPESANGISYDEHAASF